MNKRFLYCYYVSEFADESVNSLHFQCIKKYIHLFDQVTIYITIDDTSDDETIKSIMQRFIDVCPNKEIDFKVVQNSFYVTSEVYKSEVIENMGNDDYVFFAHNKGFVYPDGTNIKNVLKYVYALYYFTLEDFVLDFARDVFKKQYCMFGAFTHTCNRYKTQHKWAFSGGFHWVNSKALQNMMLTNGFEIPEIVRNEYYYEDFLSNFLPFNELSCCLYGSACQFDSWANYFTDIDTFINWTYESFEEEFNKSYTDFVKSYAEKTIEVIYTCTGDYYKYAEEFINSLKWFFPSNKKYVKVITDNKELKLDDYVCSNIDKIDIVYRPVLFYPFTNLHKMMWIKDVASKEYDYLFYFDADSLIIDNYKYNWEELSNKIEVHDVLLTKHQAYITKDPIQWTCNFFTPKMTCKNTSSPAFISDNEYDYVISAFFGGRTSEVIRFCDKINSMITADLTQQKGYYIPPFYDEAYTNALAWQNKTGRSNEFNFCIEHYNAFAPNESRKSIPCWNTIDNPPSTVFVYQKNLHEEYKTTKK